MKSKRGFPTLLVIIFGVMACSIGYGAGPAVGSRAADFELVDIAGSVHRLSDYRGKVVVLEWVNPECPFVRHHYDSGNIPRLQRSATTAGVVWLAINSGKVCAQGDFEAAEVQAWMKKTGSEPSAYARDENGEIGRLFDARATPHFFVVNADGVLVYKGAIDSIASTRKADLEKATNYVDRALGAIADGRSVEPAETRAYGCSVKY